MKSEEEIKDEIYRMRKCLKEERVALASEVYGYIQALEWVLQEDNQ